MTATSKTFAAIDIGGFVLFAFVAKSSTDARQTIQSIRKRSDSIDKVRLLRADDMSRDGTIQYR